MNTKSNLFTSLTAAAIVTFGAIEVYAQKASDHEPEKIRIKIERNINGGLTEIDTVIDAADKGALEKFLKENNLDDNAETDGDSNMTLFQFEVDQESNNSELQNSEHQKNRKKKFHIQMDSTGTKSFSFDFDWTDDQKLKELVEKLRHQHFDFNFKMPELPVMPDLKWEVEGMNDADQEKFEKHMKQAQDELKKAMDLIKDSLKFRFRFFDDMQEAEKDKEEGFLFPYKMLPACEAIASGNDKRKLNCEFKAGGENKVKTVIVTSGRFADNEATASDKKIKVAKVERVSKANMNQISQNKTGVASLPENKISEEGSKSFRGLNVFPNPADRKFQLEFDTRETGNLTVRILNSSGLEVVSELYENFTGSFSQSYDLTSHGKGVYLIIIKQNQKWEHKKVVLK